MLMHRRNLKKYKGSDTEMPQKVWGYSSVGRAPALQAGGQGFESLYLHHLG